MEWCEQKLYKKKIVIINNVKWDWMWMKTRHSNSEVRWLKGTPHVKQTHEYVYYFNDGIDHNVHLEKKEQEM